MSTSGIGSSQSFWQQDQAYWSQSSSNSSSVAATDSVINAMASAQTRLGKGLASIANQTALNRVNSQLSAAIQSILNGGTTPTSSSSSSTSTAKATPAKPATGVGTASVTVNTPLSQLGIPQSGSITVGAGSNATTYASTGSDTVGDLMLALNNRQYGNAQVTASLSPKGDLTIKSNNTTDTVTVSGVYASNVGFAPGNRTFKPTAATGSPAPSSTSSTASTHKTSSSTTAAAKKSYTTTSSEMLGSAASVLADSGAGGSLVDMLA
jgi:hypothetical protein